MPNDICILIENLIFRITAKHVKLSLRKLSLDLLF